MSNKHTIALAVLLGATTWASNNVIAQQRVTCESSASQDNPTTYHTAKIDDVEVFYREAGAKDAPTIVLLHGFPTSSHMFRNLIPKLSDRYHVIAL